MNQWRWWVVELVSGHISYIYSLERPHPPQYAAVAKTLYGPCAKHEAIQYKLDMELAPSVVHVGDRVKIMRWYARINIQYRPYLDTVFEVTKLVTYEGETTAIIECDRCGLSGIDLDALEVQPA